MSELAASGPLKLHALCHVLALAALLAAIAIDDMRLVRIGGAIGLAGGLAFAWFTADVTHRIVRRS
jgi:hypothetical protein